MTIYIGLDTAITTGIAIYDPSSNRASVVQVKGTPLDQLVYIFKLALPPLESMDEDNIGQDLVFVMEKLHHFRNAKTVRGLLERYGYIKYTLVSSGYPVKEIAPGVARSLIGVTNKEGAFRKLCTRFQGAILTSNHTDAVACAVAQALLDGYDLNVDEITICNLEMN